MKLFSGPPLSRFGDSNKNGVRVESAPQYAKRPAMPAAAVRSASEPQARSEQQARSEPQGRPQQVVRTTASQPAQLRVVALQRLAAGGRWRVEAMRAHSEPALIWFTRGQGRITIDGVTRGYGAHNAIFLPPHVMHGFEVSSQTFGSIVFFGFDHGLSLPDRPIHIRVRDQIPQSELSGLIDNIQREIEAGKAGAERAAHFHLGLLGIWIERHLGDADEKRPDAARRIAARFTALLEREFRSGKGVADYASALGVTPTHLTRVCKQTCGRSASDLLHDRVTFEARKLLVETGLPIAEVARTLGFTSPAYFTRAFQNRTGKTPSAFRRGR